MVLYDTVTTLCIKVHFTTCNTMCSIPDTPSTPWEYAASAAKSVYAVRDVIGCSKAQKHASSKTCEYEARN